MSDVWNPDLYGRFEKERAQPFYDLLDMVQPAAAMRVIDLGCGSGELTLELLEALGFSEVEVVLRVYLHRLDGPETVVDWVRGTSLTPYEERLPASLFAEFLSSFRERLLACLPSARPFPFPFNRILFHAVRTQ